MKKIFILLSIFVFMQQAQAQSWLTTGNSATSSIINFIGTKDFQALVFRTNNAERMRILTNGNTGIGTNSALQKLDVVGNINIRSGFALFMDNHGVLKVDSLKGNTFLGNGVAPNNSGFYNTASGTYALKANTTGSNNTASGAYALSANTTGNYNTATGYASLYVNLTGNYNTATGYASLYYNSGSNNTASGYASLYYNATGSNNTAMGTSAMYKNQIGANNVAVGDNALYNNEGHSNVACGSSALYSASNAYGANTAIGDHALYSANSSFNTATGNYVMYANTSGYHNTAMGYSTLGDNTTGILNTAMGSLAMVTNVTGSYNTGIGSYALFFTTASQYNTAVGYNAGTGYDNGWNNVFLGANADVNGTGYYNVVAIGQGALCTTVNQARIGNSFTTSIGGYANWTNISDKRVKKNIKENVPGLMFINKLKAITYNLDLEAADKIIQPAIKKDKDGKIIQRSLQEVNARNAKEQIIYTGFAAQDVEKAAKELNYDFSGVDAAKSNKDLYGLRYAEFVVPLVKAVQELSKDNDDLKSTLSNVVAQLAEVKKQLDELKISKSTPGTQLPSADFARLEQNVPNPFSNATVINYYIPAGTNQASLTISNMNGQILKTISLNNKGTGKTTISAGELAAGDYFYTLFIDGRKADTKQMEHLK